MAISDINTLMEQAKCFRCLSHKELVAVQTYIIAYASGHGMDPGTLLGEAKCLLCLTQKNLFQIRAYLIAYIGGLSTDPQTLAGEAECYRCIPDGMLEAIRAYLFSLDPNGPGETSPEVLESDAVAFKGLTPEESLAIQVYLLALNAGVSTDPSDLYELAKCFNCLSFEVLNSVTTKVIDEVENDGGINGGGETPCVDVPADLIPVITGVYTDGILTDLDILLPKVCCDPHHVTIYEADDAIGTGAVAIATTLIADSHAGETNYSLPTYTFGSTPAKDYILVKQFCEDGSSSDFSNAVIVDGTCGIATAVIEVTGAGDPDANGLYFFNQPYYDLSGLITYDNPDTGWIIEFTGGGSGVEAYMRDAATAEKYELPISGCFPCGPWTQYSGINPGDLPAPTATWSDINVEAVSWYDRVVKNGGAQPSNNSVEAAAVFMDALTTASIRTKIKALNFIAPDSLIAATTPLIKDYGNDPWTNTAFVLADLSVDGMKSDGLTKFLNTGVNPTTVWGVSTTTAGLSLYHVGPIGLTGLDIGASNATGGTALTLYAEFGGTTYFDCWANAGGGRVSYANLNFRGFISGNRLNANDIKLYDANSGSAFQQRASGVNTLGSVPNVGPCSAFGYNNNGVLSANTSRRISFFAIHDGLTSAEAEDLYDAVQALRTSLGGGYI